MDPISNMIIMIKNGSTAGKATVSFPYSKIKNAVALCLQKEGYVKDVAKKVKKDHPVLEIELVYTDKKPKISGVERISKQSRRVYFGMRDIHTVLGGKGVLVLSTPKGILSGRDARREQVGGEALFKIW
ncbi:30S ribosomal protein S8 [Candidatus Nomurabacteria bacterium RIFCSPLOWO2_01_FULL_41_21]|uniref:Small ribosomal subunit protein uS8 n=2 Tax=Candidatus Nomuraibacteriota TaxID=1752729 RepID=A0A1F6V459_9BACT|nr:MAG: 30S ribosomal protein S8 [Candidatus Nomurabacteria bacterium RIFCSPHIGHO2_01_FULL_40_20]OGI88384.1 MAG: 30S ribosomal protein S8 [Candidatus Nomurabacteria bacterium RIFCSPLOWO2_01_FULL_41_21]